MRASGLENYKNVAYFEYNFAKHGGAISSISVQGASIPAGSVIVGGMIHVKTAGVGVNGTMAIGTAAGSTTNILGATAVASLTLNALLATVPVPQTANTWIRLTSNLTALLFTIATTAFTAGRVLVALDYYTTEE